MGRVDADLVGVERWVEIALVHLMAAVAVGILALLLASPGRRVANWALGRKGDPDHDLLYSAIVSLLVLATWSVFTR